MATTPDNPSEQDRFEYDHNAASAFMWAWAQLEGWGDQKDGAWRKWNFSERIAKAQFLAGYAYFFPVGGPSKSQAEVTAEAEEAPEPSA